MAQRRRTEQKLDSHDWTKDKGGTRLPANNNNKTDTKRNIENLQADEGLQKIWHDVHSSEKFTSTIRRGKIESCYSLKYVILVF